MNTHHPDTKEEGAKANLSFFFEKKNQQPTSSYK